MTNYRITLRTGNLLGTPRRATVVASLLDRLRRNTLVILAIVLLVLCCRPNAAAAQTHRTECPPKILVLRGLMEVFSLGMNDLAQKLECRGYDVELTSWSMALWHADCSDPRPIVVIGHSLGGRMCAWVSRKLKECGVSVPLIIIVDANIIQSIPSNVERCVHLYVTNELGIFHGSPVESESLATEVVNWDVSKGQPPWYQGGVNHFDIDATPWVHDIIMKEIAQRFPPPCGFVTQDFETDERLAVPRAEARLRRLPSSLREQYEPPLPSQTTRPRSNIALVAHHEPVSQTSPRSDQRSFRPTRRRTTSPTIRAQGFTTIQGVDGKSISIGSLGGP